MTASKSINEELHTVSAPEIWLTCPLQPGTVANSLSSNWIGSMDKQLAHKVNLNKLISTREAFYVGNPGSKL
jgi:hypothetical protein